MYRRFQFDAKQGSKNLTNLRVLPAIGEGITVDETGSVTLSDIHMEESEQGSQLFPQPINKIEIFNKQSKNVHFDHFVYIRYSGLFICMSNN